MTALGILLLIAVVVFLARSRPKPTAEPSDLTLRVERLERELSDLQLAVRTMRVPRREPAAAPTPPRVAPAPATPPAPPMATRVSPPRSFDWSARRPSFSFSDLLGAKALAFTGGVVTLLGVVFFFVLAVNRGWIGPSLRITFGAVASAFVFTGGVWLRRRYGVTYAALTAVGTGIAGAYVTLLAAVSLYDLVSKPVALAIAGLIASLGLVFSLAWDTEIVAGFGLIGAMVVPATLAFQGGLQEIGTAFVAIMFAAAAIVAVHKRWWKLLQAAAIVSAPQALAQVAAAEGPRPGIVVIAATFWVLFLAAGLAFQLRLGRALAAAPASFVIGSAVFAGASAMLLYNWAQQGHAVLVVSSVYLLAAVVLFRRVREVATLVWALGLGLAAVGLAETFSNSGLTVAWAAEAALLAWLAARLRDTRFQLASLAYLGLALLHSLAAEGDVHQLFEPLRHPAKGAPALLAVAFAALVFASLNRSDDTEPATGILRVLEPLLERMRAHKAQLDIAGYALACLLGIYAASLGILELFQDVWPDGAIQVPFEWGHVAIDSVWAIAGLAAVYAGTRVRSRPVRLLGFGWLAVTVVKLVSFDVDNLAQSRYGIAFLAVGFGVLAAGLAHELVVEEDLSIEGALAAMVGMILIVAGGLVLTPNQVAGMDGNGLVLVSAGAFYVLLAAGFFGKRDLSTLLWILGLAATAAGEQFLFSGVWLVLAYALSAALLAAVSVRVEERRLQVASLVYLLSASLLAVAVEAPPADFLVAQEHPARGVPSLLLVIAAGCVFAWSVRWNEPYRLHTIWVTGALSVYAVSLSILDAAQRISPEGVETDFQRGHTAVSAFWGVLALVSLYVGLKRRRSLLRAGGFILFGISLGKLFLYDLPSLSSVQRAFSFLAVGAVLLLGGFFYQRLSVQYDERVT